MKRLGSSNKIQGILQLQQHPTTRARNIQSRTEQAGKTQLYKTRTNKQCAANLRWHYEKLRENNFPRQLSSDRRLLATMKQQTISHPGDHETKKSNHPADICLCVCV